jgi:hypothetical protein
MHLSIDTTDKSFEEAPQSPIPLSPDAYTHARDRSRATPYPVKAVVSPLSKSSKQALLNESFNTAFRACCTLIGFGGCLLLLKKQSVEASWMSDYGEALRDVQTTALCACTLGLLFFAFRRGRHGTWLLSFSTFKPPSDWRVTRSEFRALHKNAGMSEENVNFVEKVTNRSDIGM